MKKMTGKTTVTAMMLAVILMLSVFLAGCGGEKEPVTIDTDAAAKAILDGVRFEDTLAQLDDEAVKYLYGFDDTVKGTVYVGSGATAEEIAVFEAASEEAGETLKADVEQHVADQIESYRNYVPAEVDRLEKAIIIREGKYVLLCVTDDTAAAESIMKEAVKG